MGGHRARVGAQPRATSTQVGEDLCDICLGDVLCVEVGITAHVRAHSLTPPAQSVGKKHNICL
eukprot:1154236-Pelagomonas_calceolata.AAC.1